MGALTAKPYSFRNRVWELISIESIDILDSLCSNIRIDTRNNVVERILPKTNDNLNEEWITDKIRFCYDGFKKQRLSFPLYKFLLNSSYVFVLSSWHLIFNKIKTYYLINYNNLLSNNFFYLYTGHLIDVFTINIVKHLSSVIGITNLNINLNLNIDLRKYFIFNNNIKSFELNNVFLIFGTNPKIDSPILNIKLRHLKYKFNKKVNICYIGSKLLINYSLLHLGNNMNTLLSLFYGKSFFCKTIKRLYNIVCLSSIGFNFSISNNLSYSLDMLSFFLKKQNFIHNHLSLFSSDVSIYELGITSYYFSKSLFIKNIKPLFFYLLGVDYNNMLLKNINNNFNIYHGHHGNSGLFNSNIILPSNNYIENTCFFLNCEGRLFVSNLAITKKKKINNNESIIYNLFNYFSNNKKKKLNLKRIFFLFYYKNTFFFTKFKFITKFYLNTSYLLLKRLSNNFFVDKLFNINNNFYNMDVFSKSSYYILKIKENYINKNFF